VFQARILGAAHSRSNKIQRKDFSAAIDPSDPIRFAEGLGLPPLAKFRVAKRKGAGGKKTDEPPKH
jgi:hypothetical protein